MIRLPSPPSFVHPFRAFSAIFFECAMVSVVTAQQQLAAVGAADGRVPTMVTAAQQTQIKRAINLHLREQGVFASLKAIDVGCRSAWAP